MKNLKNITIHLLLSLLIVLSVEAFGQSISGNVNSFGSEMDLSFANINIYKAGKLVANVLTDESGNFNIKLDTGVYECEINYAGFKKITKEIIVKSDEKSDFSLAADKKSDFSAAEMETYLEKKKSYHSSLSSSGYRHISGFYASYAWGESTDKDSAKSNRLTAAEINDFSKWKQWTDMNSSELKMYKNLWHFSLSDRYTLQLTDNNHLPLANASVSLIREGETVYKSKTDNTGKAEMWGTTNIRNKSEIQNYSIKIEYLGQIKIMNHVKKFSKGINTYKMSTECWQPKNVDIAIVVDATGSMQDEMNYLKYDLNKVIYQSKKLNNTLNFRFANVFYRDTKDAYLTKTQDFTNVLSESIAFSNSHNAAGGGDGPEAVEVALEKAIHKLSWSSDTRAKILFLVLDAPPHNTAVIRKKIVDLCKEASAKGIRIVPITGSGSSKDNEYLMRSIALATNGTYVFLSNHSGIGKSHIKPSTEKYSVEILNDLLIRIIKSYTYMPDCQQQITDLGVNIPDSTIVIPMDTTTTELSSIKDSIALKWSFYPNPTKGIINIKSNKKIEELYISDLSGKVLKTIRSIEADKTTKVDLSEYSTGIYLIRYPYGKQWISGKIVLAR